MTLRRDDEQQRAIARLPQAIEDAALAALELDDAGRADALRALLAREPAHRATIAAWLGRNGVPIPGDAATAPERAPHPDELSDPPRRIGPYRIVRLLGRGGFGSVFLAEAGQAEPRPVAIKVLNPGMDSREFLRRFRAEREALDRLDHPGIARLLDSGETALGRPYVVLEYVPGDNLVLHCRRRDLPMTARLALFRQVLDAMAHAHQKGILHRDLSAKNVLVSEDRGRPQPKIIDFGVAKSFAAPLQDSGVLTLQGTMMGTPEYMSPEQARGEIGAVDTRTDVYSLGVLLYELLTDELPVPAVALRAQGIAGIAQAIASHEPARPSQVAPRRRRARLRGDLDAIVLKAIAKDRDERYASVLEFAADLRRHQEHKPVLAGPPGGWYQLRKFVRRHFAGVVVTAAFLATLVGATVFSVRLWLQARDAREALQEMHDELEEKARTGFRLLADEERLLMGAASAREFAPPWPEKIPAMEAWLRNYAQKLERELSRLQERRGELEALQKATPGGALPTEDQHLLAALRRLETRITEFIDDRGDAGFVRRQLAWARDVAERSLAEHAAAWQQAARDLKADRGFDLVPQPGLVPLGRNPNSRLHEFLDLASHPRDLPPPTRDPVSGELRLDPRGGIVFALVPAGRLQQGAQREPGLPQFDALADDSELGGGAVQLAEFLIARTELTNAQWQALSGGAPEDEPPNLPAIDLDWTAATATLGRWGMALPTEAQWEYACRGDTATPWWKGGDTLQVRGVGNFDGALAPVARLEPNPFGLFDVHGNAAEWCADALLPYPQSKARAGDGMRLPIGPVRAPDRRVVRGGHAGQPPAAARCSARASEPPGVRAELLGLRPVRALRR